MVNNDPRQVLTEAAAFNRCDSGFTDLIRNAPQRNIWVSGILLATRYTNRDDLNPINGIDYMAQGR